MAFFTELESQVAALRGVLGEDAAATDLVARVLRLPDADVTHLLRAAGALRRYAERLEVVGAGVVASRSTRSAGHAGLAQSHGHRSAASFLQDLTGTTRAEAHRQIRLGESLIEEAGAQRSDTDAAGAGHSHGAQPGATESDSGGAASGAGDRGTGAPGQDDPDLGGYGGNDDSRPDGPGSPGPGVDGPGVDGPDTDVSGADGPGAPGSPGPGSNGPDAPGTAESGAGSDDHLDDDADSSHDSGAGSSVGSGPDTSANADDGDADAGVLWHAPLGAALLAGRLSSAQHDAILRGLGTPPDDSAETHAAWRAAAEQLISEAPNRSVEELGSTARGIRDRLDPDGALRRFQERFERRSFRTWRDADGVKHASCVFDDEGAAFLEAIINAALRPRVGPRFVDASEKRDADALMRDPRSNDQLAYDLLLDIIRAGVLAEPKAVFGTRQAGVRLVTIARDDGTPGPIGHTEDGLHALPAAIIDQRICDTGYTRVLVDSCGNPLDLGRERRLFSPAQRLTLAIRDGGCRWRGCDRPASVCEAHHIDHWCEDKGSTDIDRGILLCRFHHMQLHHGGWRITRDGRGDFLLHPPDGQEPIPLPPRLALRYAWGDIDPPPRRFRPTAA